MLNKQLIFKINANTLIFFAIKQFLSINLHIESLKMTIGFGWPQYYMLKFLLKTLDVHLSSANSGHQIRLNFWPC